MERSAWLFWGSFAVIAGVSYYMSRTTYLVFKAGEPSLVVMKNRPSPAALAEFLRELQDRKSLYFAQSCLTHTNASSVADALQKLERTPVPGVLLLVTLVTTPGLYFVQTHP